MAVAVARTGFRGFVVSTLLVCATIAFTLSINFGAFRQNYASTLMAAYAVVGDKAVGNIQEALGYGKRLDRFYGMDAILKQITLNLPWVLDVKVAMADGRIVQTTEGDGADRMAESTRRRAAAELAKRGQWSEHNAASGTYSLYIPIRTPGEQDLTGFLIMESDGTLVEARVEEFLDSILPLLLWTGLGTIALLGLSSAAVAWLARRKAGQRTAWLERNRRRLSLAALLAMQVATSAEYYSMLSNGHMLAAEQATHIVARMVRNDIRSITERGPDYESLHGIDAYFDRIRASLLTVQSIELLESDRKPTVTDDADDDLPLLSIDDLTLRWPLPPDRNDQSRDLVIVVDGDRIVGEMSGFGLDMATVLITSMLFMFELHRVLGDRQKSRTRNAMPGTADFARSIRFATFLMYFGTFLSVSFVPLMMGRFDGDLFGLSPSRAAAAPLTAEMLCGVAAALAAGWLTGRFGWRAVALAGFSAAAAGSALAAVAADPLPFVLARGLSGAGTMAGLIATNALIGRLRAMTDTPALQSGMFAGMYAGVNCGAVSGALLAASQGPVAVFAAGALIPLAGLFYTAFGIPRLPEPTPPTAHGAPAAAATPCAGAERPPRRIKVPLFLALISLPTAVAAMFLPFYLPLFIADIGLSSSTVGRAYLLHGLCVILAGPLLTRLAARRLPVPGVTLLSAAMIAGALTLFGFQASLWTAFGAVFVIGLAESFGLSAQIRHVELLAAREARRRDSVLALHVNTRKLGQAAGPLLFGTLAAAVPLGAGPEGVGAIGALLAGSLLLFALLTWRRAVPSHPRTEDGR
ncbi:MFS transporter [Roseomonas genomospecies 6]|uniref:MFS transporter n=1 Tax=Roseomonas genomospecies 6 TaxID=214106 RepID=A0A9W7NIS8_9PROT|nr:MFS transporter [Roseomonas genomospecies 6]KAA0679755.1 MFS transporter [Roseomonas genomospecies 6]